MATKKKKDWNPYAICRAQQNKTGMSDAETERCIKKVKKKLGWTKHKKGHKKRSKRKK